MPDPPDEPEEATVELAWPDISRPTIGYEQGAQGGVHQGMWPPSTGIPYGASGPFEVGGTPPPGYPPLDLSPPPRRFPAWPFVVLAVLVGLIVLAVVVLWLV